MGEWGSAAIHRRDMRPVVSLNTRRRCPCGCGTAPTHVGRANGVALMSGCEFYVRRWVRDWRVAPPKEANDG